MIEGSSIAPEIVAQVQAGAKGRKGILVFLDSNHTHDHVLAELNAYAALTSVGSYCVVFDTLIEDMPAEMFPDRPWGKGDNPKTALRAYLTERDSGSGRAGAYTAAGATVALLGTAALVRQARRRRRGL